MLKSILSIKTRMVPHTYIGEHIPCNLCGSLDKQTVGRRDRYFNKLHTVMCRQCGLIFTDPMPTAVEVSRYYEKDYRTHYHGAAIPTKKAVYKGFKGAKSRYQRIKPILKQGMTLIDVGSGGGEFVSYLNEHDIQAVGIEPNEGFSEYAKTTYHVPIVKGSWETASFEPESVDVITLYHVLEHFREPLQALAKFHQWLKVGAYLHVTVPNIVNPKGTPFTRFHFAHLYNFSPETLLMMAQKVGFEATTILAPGTTDIILKKVEKGSTDWFFEKTHAREMARYFETYTNRRYFFSLTPYFRWIMRMNKMLTIALKSSFVFARKKANLRSK